MIVRRRRRGWGWRFRDICPQRDLRSLPSSQNRPPQSPPFSRHNPSGKREGFPVSRRPANPKKKKCCPPVLPLPTVIRTHPEDRRLRRAEGGHFAEVCDSSAGRRWYVRGLFSCPALPDRGQECSRYGVVGKPQNRKRKSAVMGYPPAMTIPRVAPKIRCSGWGPRFRKRGVFIRSQTGTC